MKMKNLRSNDNSVEQNFDTEDSAILRIIRQDARLESFEHKTYDTLVVAGATLRPIATARSVRGRGPGRRL